jgi:hypothetical protein
MIVDTDQLVSATQALDIVRKRQGQGEMSERLLAYYLKKSGAPKPILVAGKKCYLKDEIEAWNPINEGGRGRKPNNKEETQ